MYSQTLCHPPPFILSVIERGPRSFNRLRLSMWGARWLRRMATWRVSDVESVGRFGGNAAGIKDFVAAEIRVQRKLESAGVCIRK